MSKKQTKRWLFDRYRKNIELIATNPYYKKDVLKGIVICPLCCTVFNETQIEYNKDGSNFLTVEHVPPRYLGGRTEVFTCHYCNNAASDVDNHVKYLSDTTNRFVQPVKLLPPLDENSREPLKFGTITTVDLDNKLIEFKFSNINDLNKMVEASKGAKHFNMLYVDRTREIGTNLLKMAYLLAFHNSDTDSYYTVNTITFANRSRSRLNQSLRTSDLLLSKTKVNCQWVFI